MREILNRLTPKDLEATPTSKHPVPSSSRKHSRSEASKKEKKEKKRSKKEGSERSDNKRRLQKEDTAKGEKTPTGSDFEGLGDSE